MVLNFNCISLAPKISIEIIDSTGGTFPMAGQNYDIICGVHGAENLNSTITYQWTRNNETGNDNNSKSLQLESPMQELVIFAQPLLFRTT